MLRNNNSLRAIQEGCSAAGYDISRAKAGYGPRLDAYGRYGFGKLSSDTTRKYRYDDNVAPYSSVSLTLSQLIFDGFKVRSQIREAEAVQRSMEARVIDNATSLALDVIRAQVDVLNWQRICTLMRQNVDYHEKILSQTSERAASGVDTRADVTQTESRLLRARARLAEATASLRVAEETYSRLTYLPALMLAEVPSPDPLYGGPDEIFEIAKTRNPKLLAYYQDVQAARAKKEGAAAAYYPTLSIEAGPSYSDRDGRSQLWTYEFGVAGVVRWNLFNSGADVAENKAAMARIRQSRRTLYDYAESLKLAVSQSWTEYNSAREQMAQYTSAAAANKVTRDAYKDQFVLGQRSLLDVLDAESEYLNSSTQAITAQGNVLVAAYRMRALAGELLSGFNIDEETLPVASADHEPLDHVTLPKDAEAKN